MGLAASQARLLTITARKSDCEFQSMRYSHQKIALSRNMTDISNEYQNALNQTKLVYDYYGTGDASTPLTYGLMMTPSELNGHMPILTTDASGKIVLNTQFAAAARAAGIPQEGLGCLPSTTVRNKYLKALADYGLISQEAAATYQGIFYAQEIGVGTTDLVTSTVQKMNLEEMLDYYASYGDYSVYADLLTELKSGQVGSAGANGGLKDVAIYNGYNNTDAIDPATLSIIDILEGNYKIICKTSNNGYDEVGKALGSLNVWEWMFEEMAGMLNISGDANISGAIAYAESMTRGLLDYDDGHAHYYGRADKGFGVMNYDYNDKGAHTVVGALFGDKTQVNTSSYIGIVDLERSNWFSKQDFASIDMTNIAKAYLTYFAQYMEGITTSEYMISSDSSNRKVSDSHLIDDKFMFDVLVNQGVNTDQALNSGFYDAMFNQICLKGWIENPNVDDKDYLQEMFQNGLYFISTCSDDGNYYQGNYSTNTFIKEVADEEAIARAEAKYNTEKQKINSKEEVIDMKMKNLDTEISSLTTEYDTIKSLISKNIEKSFKRYDA